MSPCVASVVTNALLCCDVVRQGRWWWAKKVWATSWMERSSDIRQTSEYHRCQHSTSCLLSIVGVLGILFHEYVVYCHCPHSKIHSQGRLFPGPRASGPLGILPLKWAWGPGKGIFQSVCWDIIMCNKGLRWSSMPPIKNNYEDEGYINLNELNPPTPN